MEYDRFGMHQGTVVIYNEGEWVSISHDFWSLADAKVACRMLGFKDAIRAFYK